MTGYPTPNLDLMLRNLPKVQRLAHAAQVTSILITGKGEPCMNIKNLMKFISSFKDYPVELQTNGRRLANSYTTLDRLVGAGLNVLAVSMDEMLDFKEYEGLFERAKNRGLVNRAVINLTDKFDPKLPLRNFLEFCIEKQVDQLTFRKIMVPNFVVEGTAKSEKAQKWIKKHTSMTQYTDMMKEIQDIAHHVIRELPFGATVYDIDGIAVTAFDYCVQDMNNNEDIRSLIFMEDGHVYTSWNSKASILF
jgi:MoaA/NifB/PqqE/SkfB family radical SAM enzyme